VDEEDGDVLGDLYMLFFLEIEWVEGRDDGGDLTI
jgi:hypothetical protein